MSSLTLRILSALILAPIVIAIIYFGGLAFMAMMTVIGVIGIFEWIRMIKPFNLARVIFGILYVSLSIATMVWLRVGIENGLYYTLLFMLIVWGSDIAAFFTGKTFQGPKLAPKISPKKTWSGFIGSSVGAGLIAAGFACPMVMELFKVENIIGNWGYISLFIMGFILAMFGQAGDLFISIVKRTYNVKDTGNVIPGHGGILDRIDALLLVAPIFAAIHFYVA